MAHIMDVIKGISQAAALNYDGSQDPNLVVDGDTKNAGLERDKGNINLDYRIMDGYNVRIQGKTLMVTYHSESKLKDVHRVNKFESDIDQHLADIVSYLKREYKKITGDTLALTRDGEADIQVEHMNTFRTWVVATQNYTIGGITGVMEVEAPSKDRLDQAVRDWLSLGKNDH
jgi:hypothetical protein